jgi:hypothetical protein
MWARFCEIILGTWLFSSHFIFSTKMWIDLALPPFILICSLLSFYEKLNKMHLLQIIPAGWLIFLGYSYPTPWLPFYYQNYILIALSLLVFAIIPSNASEHPRAWKKFLNDRSNKSN